MLVNVLVLEKVQIRYLVRKTLKIIGSNKNLLSTYCL